MEEVIVINPISMGEILGKSKIQIPLLQRDYAQGRIEKSYIRKNILNSIKDVLEKPDGKLPMYLIYGYQDKNNKEVFYPLDGQQRLTTLWLVYWYLALRSGKMKEEREKLLNFSYETRKSSREFCRALCEIEEYNNSQNGIVEYIENQTWFFEEWKQDPTIASMLRMIGGTNNKDGIEPVIDEIDENHNKNKRTFEKYLDRFKNNITCYMFHLNSKKMPKEAAERLYVKMNARGKALSDFEDFKSALIDEMKKNNDVINNEPISDYVSRKLDGDWNDTFWEALDAGNGDGKTDEVFFSFIHRFLLNRHIIKKEGSNYAIDAEDVKLIEAVKGSAKIAINNEKKVEEIRKEEKYKKKDLLTYDYLKNDTQISYTEYTWYKNVITTENLKDFDRVMKGLHDNRKEIEEILSKINKTVSQRAKVSALGNENEEDSASITDDKERENIEDDGEEEIGENSFVPVYDYQNGKKIYHEDKSGNYVGNVKRISLKGRAYFFAVCKYLEIAQNFDKALLSDWMRVARNIIENSGIAAEAAMISVIRKLDDLGKGSSNIYDYLKNLDFEDDNSKLSNQINEEIEKAKRIVSHPADKVRIQDAEDSLFLCGCIRFLFRNGSGKNDDNGKAEKRWGDFEKKKTAFDRFFKDKAGMLEFSKNYASSFKDFGELANKERLVFHTKGWQSRGDSWLDVLCSDDYEIIHGILTNENKPEYCGAYKAFIDSETFKMLVLKDKGIMINKDNNGKETERKEKQNLRVNRQNDKFALYKKAQREEKMYFDDNQFKRNKLLFDMSKKGIVIDDNHCFGQNEAFYWGEDIYFESSGKKYRWNVEDVIFEVDINNNSKSLKSITNNASSYSADEIIGMI